MINTISLVVSCLPMMSDLPSGAQVMPRIRGPGGSSITLRKSGRAAAGSMIQMDAGAFAFWLTMASWCPSGDQAICPFANPEGMAGVGAICS